MKYRSRCEKGGTSCHDVSENKWVSYLAPECHDVLCPSNKDSYEIWDENKEAACHDVTETKGVRDDSQESRKNLSC